ncbi:heparinase II/III family protein [Flavicella sediminum]|uniref:heparinase II/III family protein n=1 Tax=Flavicella sediminum TaxID=2585141 RepID=UPI00111D3808|nr:heparinase II/III family protein [Flavicella sediminum]
MLSLKKVLFCAVFVLVQNVYSQEIPATRIIENTDLASYLHKAAKNNFSKTKVISEAELASYFRKQFSKRYFYDWQNFKKRFDVYQELYPAQNLHHKERAEDHLSKFSSATTWLLPFNYTNGNPVNAYALRHLARQHKMVDIALYKKENTESLAYFLGQMHSLNRALKENKYEKIKDGNGVYEAFRSGYRVLNWLQIHAAFLSNENYSDKDQLITIATLMQHGAHLYKNNKVFHAGNHQTRGLSALAMLSIIFNDFEDSKIWFDHSVKLLQEHLNKEINEDGFQFERTVHYHMSDILNYFYVYRLVLNNKMTIDATWEEKLKSLFTSLCKIAYPDKSAPVFSDDTDAPWAEKNDISNALTLGYLLFEDPTMGYFAKENVSPQLFWHLNQAQLNSLKNIQSEKPMYGSVYFPTTGFYFMRQGWETNAKMLVISAGLDKDKPDHQHGDMLGIQAMANGKIILPNYQVRYSLKDLELFKNSMVKNVALVDEELQGKKYTSNQGGSGFGKFKSLPKPKNIAWNTNENLDFFAGSHDGFENIGVQYTRQVLFVDKDFWIVKDNFSSKDKHSYKQVWQGHYSTEKTPNLLRSSFDNGTGLDIFQLQSVDESSSSGKRGKNWTVVSKKGKENFSFITVLAPFKTYDKRIDEEKELPIIKGWSLNNSPWETKNKEVISLSRQQQTLLFSVKQVDLKKIHIEFLENSDVLLHVNENELELQSLSDKKIQFLISGVKKGGELELIPGEKIKFTRL